MSPPYEPKKWNKPGLVDLNNCYNYAVNILFKPDAKRKFKGPAEPGRASGVTLGVTVGFDLTRKITLGEGAKAVNLFQPAVKISCKGILNACLLDGLKKASLDDKKKPKCGKDCCLIAYYRKPETKIGQSGLFWVSADYHFVRQDKDGKWSHKPGPSPVTRNQYNPKKGDFSGKPITDPEKDNVGAGYLFCGYLCVCPKEIQIASADISGTGHGAKGALVSFAQNHGRGQVMTALCEGTDFVSVFTQMTDALDGPWRPGFGEGNPRYRFDIGDDEGFTCFSFLIYDRSATIWNGDAHHIQDPHGLVAAQVDAWFQPFEETPPDSHCDKTPPEPRQSDGTRAPG